MDHFVVFPVNEDGIFLNPKLVGGALEDAMQPPFNFSDLFIYSHGWWTNGNNAMAEYGQYTIEFTKTFLSMQGVIKLQSGFAYAGVPVLGNERMLVADLTSLHAARIASGDYVKDGFSGSHSDISSPEIYNLIAGFAFQ